MIELGISEKQEKAFPIGKGKSHCFPHNPILHITSNVAFCGWFDSKTNLFDEPQDEPCEVCLAMHETRVKFPKFQIVT
jgi:hypothetical protein